MLHTETLKTEVLIVGAGPVGLALANFLGSYGRHVILAEAMDSLIDYPRGVGLDDESFRSIRAWAWRRRCCRSRCRTT